MADSLTPEQRHLNMSHIHGKDTGIEKLVRSHLHSDGFRYRLNVKELPGKPDILLPKYRTAIFVNGCFWHGHRNCRYSNLPKSNVEYWKAKIESNRVRDDEKFRELEALQWNVAIVWECELKKERIGDTIAKLEDIIRENGESWEKQKADRRKNRADYLLRQKKAKHKINLVI